MLRRSQMVGMEITPHKLAFSVDSLAHAALFVGGPLQSHVGVGQLRQQNTLTLETVVFSSSHFWPVI